MPRLVISTIVMIALFVCTFGAQSAARAEPLSDGFTAWNDGDYTTALREWRPLAEDGDMDAQSALGFMFYNGQGVPQDFKQAFTWYHRAAEQGNALAQNNLGLMYANGQAVQRDAVRAHMWFNLAAAGAMGAARQSAMENRDKSAKEMSPQQVEQAQSMAWRCQQSKFKDCD